MIFEGKCLVETPREKLWSFLLDPNKIGQCLPDLKRLNVESENKFTAVIAVGVGFIRADFMFNIEIAGKEPLSRVQLRAVGTGSGSSITLDLAIELKETADGSELDYQTDVKVGGMMAGLGQLIIKDTAEKTIKGIFDCVQSRSSEG
jgi:carbon monoxide dehydrogenase subunit G